MRRMDRYDREDDNLSRINKKQELYQNISNKVVYTNLSDVMNANEFDISSTSHGERTTREDYHKMQKYQSMEDIPQSRKDLVDFNYLYPKKENKIYDINSALEEARKNRQEKDLRDGKRKILDTSYNIFAGINKEELEKYREEKKKRMMTPEEEEIRELIDTIASKTLAGEIDKATTVDLLSDLMATSMLDKVDSSSNLSKVSVPNEVKKVEEEKEEIEKLDDEIEDVDKKEEEKEETSDFYSKSMDLSNNEMDLSMEFSENSLPLPVKMLIILIIIGMIIGAIIFIYQRIK